MYVRMTMPECLRRCALRCFVIAAYMYVCVCMECIYTWPVVCTSMSWYCRMWVTILPRLQDESISALIWIHPAAVVKLEMVSHIWQVQLMLDSVVAITLRNGHAYTVYQLLFINPADALWLNGKIVAILCFCVCACVNVCMGVCLYVCVCVHGKTIKVYNDN